MMLQLILLILLPFGHSVDFREQLACQQKLKSHFSKLKTKTVSGAQRAQILDRLEALSSDFAKPGSLKISSNSAHELVVEVNALTKPTHLRAVFDPGLILLAYELKEGKLSTFYCADILQ